jgi:hypothetical protein
MYACLLRRRGWSKVGCWRPKLFITDGAGIISSIVYRPDQRTAFGPETRHVFFTVYAPPGFAASALLHHLEEFRQNVETVAPAAQVERLKVFGAAP